MSSEANRLSERVDELARNFDQLVARVNDTAALDAMRKTIDELRAAVAEVEARGEAHGGRLGALDRQIAELRSGQDTLVDKFGAMSVDVGLMKGQLAEVLKKIPTGWAVVGAGAAAGLPSGAVFLWQLLQFFGVVPK